MPSSRTHRVRLPAHLNKLAINLATQQEIPESWLRGEAMQVGLLMLATRRPASDDGTYGGIAGAKLAALLRPYIVSALDFLAQHNETPPLLYSQGRALAAENNTDQSEPSEHTPEDTRPERSLEEDTSGYVDTSVAASLKSMGVEEL
jgi:hypothetical protein